MTMAPSLDDLTSEGFVEARNDPDAAAVGAAAFKEASREEVPDIELTDDTHVELPSGYLTQDGVLVQEATVRELTGADEEALAKAASPSRFINVLLERGVVKIGDEAANSGLLRNLLVGDRDALVIGIRRATFGNDVELVAVPCANCSEIVDLTIELSDIPVRKLDDPTVRIYEVPLRKGVAKLRFPSGKIQEGLLEKEKLSLPERNSYLLAQCVVSLPGVSIVDERAIKSLGMADRKLLLDYIEKHQPGPRYDELTFQHEECGGESPVYLTVGDLFR